MVVILYVNQQVLITEHIRQFIADENSCEILHARTVNKALALVQSRGSDIKLVLSSAMLLRPHEILPNPKDPEGRRTGLDLVKKIKELLPEVEIWLVTTTHGITNKELTEAGISPERYYRRPLIMEGFFRDVGQFVQERSTA